MKYLVGIGFALLMTLTLIILCFILDIDYEQIKYLSGWWSCMAYYGGIKYHEQSN